MIGIAAMLRRFPADAAKLVLGFGVVVILVLWSAIAWDLARERGRERAEAASNAANLARTLEEHLRRTIAALDQSLLILQAEYRQAPDAFSITSSIAYTVTLQRISVQVGRIAADGILADSNVPDFAPVNLADREHFKVHREAGADKLFISRPVLGRASGRWSIQLSRRLSNADGGFAGVLVISLDPRYLAEFYASIDVGQQGSVIVVGRDGFIRATNGGGLGDALADTALLESIFASPAGSALLRGPLDDISRITSYRALGDLPLAVMVGLSDKEALVRLHATELGYVLVGLALTAASLLLFILVRNQKRIAGDLLLNKTELEEHRERLRRYVADLERIAEVSAHDLQEPVRRVVAYAQLLAEHTPAALDDEGKGYVLQVVEGAHRIRRLVRDLEAFVEVDHFPAVQDLVSAEKAMAVVARRLAADIEAAGATLVVDALPAVAIDEKCLVEVFTQMVDNALRYRSPERRPIIRVSSEHDDTKAIVKVHDNGIGIEQRHWARIFEILHRIQGVDGHGGTGMGLAIVRRIVERAGGRVWVESVPGEGTTFTMTLPLHTACARTA